MTPLGKTQDTQHHETAKTSPKASENGHGAESSKKRWVLLQAALLGQDQICNSTTSLSCSTCSRLTGWPSKTPVPQMRADLSLSAKSRCTRAAISASLLPTGQVNGDF